MSAMANTTPIMATVTKPATKEKTPKDVDATPRVNIQDFCEEHYEDILPVIMDKIRLSNASVQQYPTQSSKSPQSSTEPYPSDNFQMNSGSSLTEDLTLEEKERYKADIRGTNIILQGLTPTDDLIENLTKTVALLAQSYKTHLPQTNNQLGTSSNTRHQATVQNSKVVVQNVQGRQNRVQGNNAKGSVAAGNGGENGVVLDEEQLLFIEGGQDNTFNNDVDEPPVQDLALNIDHVFQADQYDAFDSDVDEALTAQTMFMVHDHDNYLVNVGEYHEVHEMQNDIQQNYVVDSDAEYTSDSNIILYKQYAAQCISANEQNKVVNESLIAELARYKEQVKIYEKRERLELTEIEKKIDEQLRIIITDRNIKEEYLKKELHFVKMQLNSTIDHNKSMKDEVATLKKDFKQKENKYLKDFFGFAKLYRKS
ncbi:hypothetical protein Tco_1228350 [Tanacetum coccineum]